MQYTEIPHPGFCVIEILGEVNELEELQEMRTLLNGKIAQGKKKIAVSLTGMQWAYSGHVAVFIGFHKKLLEQGGMLFLIVEKEDEEIMEVLDLLGLDKMLNIVHAVGELP
jgi:anti-anti-sigma regulatory factor